MSGRQKLVNLKSRGKFDAAVYAGERLSVVVRTVAPVLMMLGHVVAVFASGLFMAQRDTDAAATAKRLNFLA